MRPGSWQIIGAAGLLTLLALLACPGAESRNTVQPSANAVQTQAILSSHFCPCQCGAHLPGSDRAPACFGCSVGKAEVSFIRESIAAGRPVPEVLLALRQPVLVEIFADYNDPRLPEIWSFAKRAAQAHEQHRVVLRAPGSDEDAIRAVEFVECARDAGRFSAWQSRLIEHDGDWDFESLVDLVGADGQETEGLESCISDIDISEQVQRDREHARERGLTRFPAVTVDRNRVPIREEALHEAIRASLHRAST